MNNDISVNLTGFNKYPAQKQRKISKSFGYNFVKIDKGLLHYHVTKIGNCEIFSHWTGN